MLNVFTTNEHGVGYALLNMAYHNDENDPANYRKAFLTNVCSCEAYCRCSNADACETCDVEGYKFAYGYVVPRI